MSLWKLLHADRIPPGVQQQLSIFPWYDPSQINDAPSTSGYPTVPRVEPGMYWQDEQTGNIFMYVKAAAGLVVGQLVTLQTPVADTVVAAGSTVNVVNTTGTYVVNAEKGNYVNFINIDTAAVGGSRVIKANGTNSLTLSLNTSLIGNNQFDADALPSIPSNGSAFSITRPFTVIVCTATTVPIGVALGTVTSGNFTIIQCTGFANILGVGSTTALVAGQPAVPAAGGTVAGSAAAAANLYTQGVNLVPQIAYAGASILIPFYMNCIGA